MAQHTLSVHKVLGSIPSIKEQKKDVLALTTVDVREYEGPRMKPIL